MAVSGCLLILMPLLTLQETFFEGDLLFQDTVLAQHSPELFVKGSHFRWPGGKVPYAFEGLSSFSSAEKEVVRRSMDDIQDRTGCVEFVETDISRGGDIVLITKLGFGTQSGQGKCWAQLGRQGGTQAVNLGADNCFNTRTVTHELLHTLGVVHEHTRFDRDDHVKIVSENVAAEKMHNFNIRPWKETDHSDSPYDYRSVMHYDIYAFSKDPDDLSIMTIQPHHKEFEGIGNYNNFMSGIDAVEVALAYECALKPETVVEYVNDNVEILKTVQEKHTHQIKVLMDKCGSKEPETTPVSCSPPASLLSVAPPVAGLESSSMVLCDDPTDDTCEMDQETLCPAGFHLCTHPEFVALNDNWQYTVPEAERPVGGIYCRGRESSAGAGHYTLGRTSLTLPIPLSYDEPMNCYYGSSRPQCLTNYGCSDSEKHVTALCCSTNPSCGDGVVTAPLEECDDGNDSDEDDCLNTCSWRIPEEHTSGYSC